MFQAKFEEAKYLTLGVGVVNVTFTLVAVSRIPPIFSLQCYKTSKLILLRVRTTYQESMKPSTHYQSGVEVGKVSGEVSLAISNHLN